MLACCFFFFRWARWVEEIQDQKDDVQRKQEEPKTILKQAAGLFFRCEPKHPDNERTKRVNKNKKPTEV